MDRRNFLRTLIGGVAAGAAVRTFPFRVFSFPAEIVKPRIAVCPADIQAIELETFAKEIPGLFLKASPLYGFIKKHAPFPNEFESGVVPNFRVPASWER